MKNRIICLTTAVLSLFVLTSSYGAPNRRSSQKKAKSSIVAKLGKMDGSGDIKKFDAYADKIEGYIEKDLTAKTPYNPEKRELYKILNQFVSVVGCNKFDTDEHYKIVEKLLNTASAHASEFNNKGINKGVIKLQKKFLKEKGNPKARELKKKRQIKFRSLRSARKSKKVSASKTKSVKRVRKGKVKKPVSSKSKKNVKEKPVKKSAGVIV